MALNTITGKKLVSVLFIIIIIAFGGKINAQEAEPKVAKTYCSIGFGVFDLLNLGLGLTNNNYQVGIKVGTIPVEEKIFSVSADFYYHFGSYSEKAGMNTWFFRVGIQYCSETGETYYDKLTYLNTRIGKKFFFSEKFGFEIDGGMMILLAQDEYHENWQLIDFDMTFCPGMGVGFFYRF